MEQNLVIPILSSRQIYLSRMPNEFWTSSLNQSMWYLYIFENFSCIIYYFQKVIWRKNISMDRTQFPILSNRQIYPENQRKSKSDLTNNAGSTTSLNSESNYGSRKFLNLIQDGSKFCLVQQNSNTLGEWKKYYLRFHVKFDFNDLIVP